MVVSLVNGGKWSSTGTKEMKIDESDEYGAPLILNRSSGR